MKTRPVLRWMTVGSVLGAIALVAACESAKNDGGAGVGGATSTNASGTAACTACKTLNDCKSGLQCIRGACLEACANDSPCAAGETCAPLDTGSSDGPKHCRCSMKLKTLCEPCEPLGGSLLDACERGLTCVNGTCIDQLMRCGPGACPSVSGRPMVCEKSICVCNASPPGPPDAAGPTPALDAGTDGGADAASDSATTDAAGDSTTTDAATTTTDAALEAGDDGG